MSVNAPSVIISPHNQAAPKGRSFVPHDNEINDLETDETKYAKLESWIARNVGYAISKKYPNREWRVEVDIPHGVVVIQNPAVSLEKGYVIHMIDRTIHQLQERAVAAAGEILERFGLTRGRKYDHDAALAIPRRRNRVDEAVTPDSLAESITGSGKQLKDGER